MCVEREIIIIEKKDPKIENTKTFHIDAIVQSAAQSLELNNCARRQVQTSRVSKAKYFFLSKIHQQFPIMVVITHTRYVKVKRLRLASTWTLLSMRERWVMLMQMRQHPLLHSDTFVESKYIVKTLVCLNIFLAYHTKWTCVSLLSFFISSLIKIFYVKKIADNRRILSRKLEQIKNHLWLVIKSRAHYPPRIHIKPQRIISVCL